MAKIKFDFYENETGRILQEFRELVAWSDLSRVIDKVGAEMQRKKTVSHALLDRYAVTLGLQRAYSYLKSTGRIPRLRNNLPIYTASTFAATAVAVSHQLSERGRRRLAGMIKDNLSLDGDARRLLHELNVAAHFSQHGWDITFVDLEGEGNFDYIVRKGDIEVDVECKTVSGDTGNVIHQVDALNFMENVYKLLLEGMPNAWWTVDVTFPLGLPKTRQEHLALAGKIARCMRDGKELEHVDGVATQVRRQEMPTLATDEELHAFVRACGRQLQNRLNGHVSSVFNKKHLLSVCVSSSRPTRMAASIYASIKRGCEQLSQRRAGHVWTHFLDLSDRELVKLVGESPNALNGVSARIFRNEDRRHMSALSYSAEGEIRLTERRSPEMIRRSFSKSGALPTHFSLLSAFPLSPGGGFPSEPDNP